MKRFVIGIFIFSALCIVSRSDDGFRGNEFDNNNLHDSSLHQIIHDRIRNERIAQEQYDAANWLPLDPYRMIGTNVVFARSAGWFLITGQVIGHNGNSILVTGKYGLPFGQMIPDGFNTTFIEITNCPYVFVGNQIEAGDGIMALQTGAGYYLNQAMIRFDYGIPCAAPSANNTKEQAEKDRASFNTLMASATNGEAWAEYSIGIRYLNGTGCETNQTLAVQWLQKAANQGNLDASNKLAGLNLPPAE